MTEKSRSRYWIVDRVTSSGTVVFSETFYTISSARKYRDKYMYSEPAAMGRTIYTSKSGESEESGLH